MKLSITRADVEKCRAEATEHGWETIVSDGDLTIPPLSVYRSTLSVPPTKKAKVA